MERVNGYYWVKHNTDVQWKLASYYDGRWCIHDGDRDEYGYDYTDSDFTTINKNRILTPDEANIVFAGQLATENAMENVYYILPKSITLEKYISVLKTHGSFTQTSPEKQATDFLNSIKK